MIEEEEKMQETKVVRAKLSTADFVLKLIVDIFAMTILVGFVWIIKDIIAYATTKLEVTDRQVIGKTGLINTNELSSPLSKISGVQVQQNLLDKICNSGTIIITTNSTAFRFKYIDKPRDFVALINARIE